MIIYALFCIAFAYFNYELIKNGKRIYHGVNGFIHLSVAVIFGIVHSPLYGLAALCLARVLFDWSLNLFRGLPLDYLPKKPKSIADKIEVELFGGNGLVGKILCILFFIILMSQ